MAAAHRRGGAATDELAVHRAFADEVLRALTAAGQGDLEARVRHVPGIEDSPTLTALRHATNRTLDLTDAFVREAGASLVAAAEGRFHRSFVEVGMPGSFRTGAAEINRGSAAMEAAAGQVVEATAARQQLADRFESVVLTLTQDVVGSADEVSGTTGTLSRSAHEVADEVRRARETVDSLSESSAAIQDVARLIDTIAAQTRLLALNATIEAARVGEAGKGFAVVAAEVKDLATQTSEATQRVSAQVHEIQAASTDAVQVMSGVGSTVTTMTDMVGVVAAAVDGTHEQQGMTRAAGHLRDQVRDFLDEMRD